MKLLFPQGVGTYSDQNGVTYLPDANGTLDIGTANPGPFFAAGFTESPDTAGNTGARPTTGLLAGLMYFDTTLGKPIWRNAANSGWVDATGTAV